MMIIEILNDGTGTDESANYTYKVKINRRVVAQGEIKRHNRNNGWENLLDSLNYKIQLDSRYKELMEAGGEDIFNQVKQSKT